MSKGISSRLPDDPRTQGFVFVVLFLVVLPAVIILSQIAPSVLLTLAALAFLAWLVERAGVLDGSGEDADPLTTLQDRYARGEIDEAEFERRLDRLVETEQRGSRDTADGEPVLERER